MSMSITKSLAKSSVQGKLSNIKNKLTGRDTPQVEWTDFNWPPCLKIMHFKLDELDKFPQIKSIVRFLFLTHLIIFVVTILNLISNFIQGIAISGEGIRIMYTFVYFILFNTLQTYFFFSGYQAIVDQPEIFTRSKIVGILMAALFCLISIVAFFNFDGWLRVSELFDLDEDFAAIIALIQDILLTIVYCLNIYCVAQIHKFQKENYS